MPHLVYSDTVTNSDAYQGYPATAMPTLAGQDVEVLLADHDSEAEADTPSSVTVLRFESKDRRRVLG
jgi:hypothetical protein